MRLITTQLARKCLLVLSQLLILPSLFLASSAAFGSSAKDGAVSAVNEVQRWGLNMTQGVTEVSHEIYGLHMLILWVCVAIGVVVFGVMFYTMIMHRKAAGAKPAQFHESVIVELAWTIIPAIILILMAIPATSTLVKIYNTDEADIDIKIVGYQWKWQYEYLGEEVSFFSNLTTSKDEIYGLAPKGEHYLLEVDEPLVIPVNKKVRFLITANDVIHSWWVPAFAVKRDAIPGFINETWTKVDEVGTYRGQCAELCGKDHGFMPIVVKVVEQAEYNEWLAGKKQEAAELKEAMSQTLTMQELFERGEKVYQTSCSACHGANGEGGVGPAMKAGAVTTGPIQQHLSTVVDGVNGTAMQAFGGQLNNIDMAAVITYERNAWGNNMGDKLQPVDILTFKKAQ